MSGVAILNPICRGLVGYISYWAACSMSEIYSEYHLYVPLSAIATSKGYMVSSEVPVLRAAKKGRGDHKRLDFVLKRGNGERIAVELKWCRAKRLKPRLQTDVDKLRAYKRRYPDCDCYLIVFFTRKGKKKELDPVGIGNAVAGKPVFWDAGKTHYAAQWFRVL